LKASLNDGFANRRERALPMRHQVEMEEKPIAASREAGREEGDGREPRANDVHWASGLRMYSPGDS
jgi:hypothetical protein